jgi:hypothetical protein
MMLVGAALGAGALAARTPAVLAPVDWTPASAAETPQERVGPDDAAGIFTEPAVAEPGEWVRIVEVCPRLQADPWVWTAFSGRVPLISDELRPGAAAPSRPGSGEPDPPSPPAALVPGPPQDPVPDPAEDPLPELSEGPLPLPTKERRSEPAADPSAADGKPGRAQFRYVARVHVPAHVSADRYELVGTCATGTLVVADRTGADHGDDRLGTEADRRRADRLTAGGVALLGTAALGGIALMRRRSDDEPVE